MMKSSSNPPCPPSIIPSYEIRKDGGAIRFKPCGTESFNLNDVRNYYCAKCKRFMNDIDLLKKRTKAWVNHE